MNDLNKKYLRVGIYERLSNEDRDKTQKNSDSESIKNQRHLLMEEINKRPEFLLVDEYCDEDLSGAGTYRPEFERLIKDCENGKIDVVLCKSQSRFSRDMEIIEKYLHNKFIEWGVRFISLADNADTDNKGNKKARQINGLVNEWYLEDVSNNIRSAFNAKMRQGEYISPFAAYGYEISKENNNKLVIDLEASTIVKEIFNLYLKGWGYTLIAKDLNKRNIPSPSLYKYQKGSHLNIISNKQREDIKWNPNAIKTILTNEIYLGNLIQGKRTTISYKNHKIIKKNKKEWIKVINTHEPIIEQETFYKVQKIIRERTKPIKNGSIHLFSGKVFCLECNKYMRKKNSSNHEYLVCSNYNNYCNCSNNKSLRYDVLETLVLNEINKIINRYYDLDLLKSLNIEKDTNLINNKLNELELEKKHIKVEISKINNYFKNLYEDKVNGLITLEQFKDLRDNYNKSNKIYLKQIEEIDRDICYYQEKKKENNTNLFIKYKCFKKLNNFIINEFIDKIYIGSLNNKSNNRIIKIKWLF